MEINTIIWQNRTKLENGEQPLLLAVLVYAVSTVRSLRSWQKFANTYGKQFLPYLGWNELFW